MIISYMLKDVRHIINFEHVTHMWYHNGDIQITTVDCDKDEWFSIKAAPIQYVNLIKSITDYTKSCGKPVIEI